MVQLVLTGTIDGVNRAFTANGFPTIVVTNGVTQSLGTDYTLTGRTITFLPSSVPQIGWTVLAFGDTFTPTSTISASQWGKLVNFEASLRKPALISFGLFNVGDNLNFIADMPSSGSTLTQATIPFSPTLSVDASAADVISVTLTANVTSLTLTYGGGAAPNGYRFWLRLVQNATGGWTVALPSSITTDPNYVIDPGANRATVLPLQWNGTNWIFFSEPFSVPIA